MNRRWIVGPLLALLWLAAIGYTAIRIEAPHSPQPFPTWVGDQPPQLPDNDNRVSGSDNVAYGADALSSIQFGYDNSCFGLVCRSEKEP